MSWMWIGDAVGDWTESPSGHWSWTPTPHLDTTEPSTPAQYPAVHTPTAPEPSGFQTDDGSWYARADPAQFPEVPA